MRYIFALACFVLFISTIACAQALALKPFVYSQDFEGPDPVKFEPWAIGVEYTMNYNGVTEEIAHSEKKSYKMDVFFKEGRYLNCVWQSCHSN